MLDLDSTAITDTLLHQTFDELYDCLPTNAADIDDTAVLREPVNHQEHPSNTAKPVHHEERVRTKSPVEKLKPSSKAGTGREEIIETKTIKSDHTITTTTTKTLKQDGKVIEQQKEVKKGLISSEEESGNKSQHKDKSDKCPPKYNPPSDLPAIHSEDNVSPDPAQQKADSDVSPRRTVKVKSEPEVDEQVE